MNFINGKIDFLFDTEITEQKAKMITALTLHLQARDKFAINPEGFLTKDGKSFITVYFRSLSDAFLKRMNELNSLKFRNYDGIGIALANMMFFELDKSKVFKTEPCGIITSKVNNINSFVFEYIDKNIIDKNNVDDIVIEYGNEEVFFKGNLVDSFKVILKFKEETNNEPILYLGVGHKNGSGYGFLKGVGNV